MSNLYCRTMRLRIVLLIIINFIIVPKNPQGGGDPKRAGWKNMWYNYETGERTATKPKS